MASKYWIKLYHEILDDQRIGPLPPELWRFTVELFLLAGETDCNGTLPNVTKIAWRLRYTVTQVEAWLKHLADETAIVTVTETGWEVTNFEKRQSASGVNERVKQFRERKKRQKNENGVTINSQNGNGNSVTNVTEMKRKVTPDIQITDINSKELGDKSPDEAEKPDGPRKQLMGIFNTETGIQMPHRKTDVKFWWSSIGELYKMVDCDVSLGEILVKEAVKRMRDKRLDITSPNSVLGYCRLILAENNGHKPKVSISAK